MLNNPVFIISVTLISLLLVLIAFLLFKGLKKKTYDEKNHKVVLDEVRNSFERQIYMLNERLIQNDERWKDVNHLLVDNKSLNNVNNTDIKIHYSEFLKANGLREQDLIIDKRSVFVLTPFNNMFYNEYATIKAAVTEMGAGLKCFRGDETEIFKGDIFPEMLKYIAQANIIVANINGRNANVLYELGIAQAMDKNVILISKEPGNLPVSVQSQRFIIYSDSNSLYNQLQLEIKKLI